MVLEKLSEVVLLEFEAHEEDNYFYDLYGPPRRLEVDGEWGVGESWPGNAVALNFDGTRIVIGSQGSVQIFEEANVYEGEYYEWTQLGSTISGNAPDQEGGSFGSHVAVTADGGRVAIGQPLIGEVEEEFSVVQIGVVINRVASTWFQLGTGRAAATPRLPHGSSKGCSPRRRGHEVTPPIGEGVRVGRRSMATKRFERPRAGPFLQ